MATTDSEQPAEPIRVISSMATRHVLSALTEAYRRRTGGHVVIESVGGVEAAKRVQSGEAFDVVVLAADALDRLAAGGHIDADSRVAIARSGVAVAIKAGARRPDMTDERAVREAVLAARSIGYSTGPSGTHLKQLFERWGIAESIASRIVQAPPGVPVGTMIANGDVELGFQQLSELIALPGVDVVGPLPAEIQIVTVFTGAVCRTAAQAQTGGAFLAYLASPDADAAKLRHGMEPARGGGAATTPAGPPR